MLVTIVKKRLNLIAQPLRNATDPQPQLIRENLAESRVRDHSHRLRIGPRFQPVYSPLKTLGQP